MKIADNVSQEIKDRVAKAKAGMKDESFHVWTGPIHDNTGKKVLAAGKVGANGFLTSINFYVNGVEGQVPGAK